MASVVARLGAFPGVLAAAVMDASGVRIVREVEPAYRPAVDRAVARFLPMLGDLRRTEPTWTSAFLELGSDYVIGRRIAEQVILVVAQTPLPLGELDRVIDSALDGALTSLRARSEAPTGRPGTMQLSEEDVVWLSEDDDEARTDDTFDESQHTGREVPRHPTSPAALAGLPQAVSPEADVTDEMDAQAAESLPRELAAVSNVIDRHGHLERHLEVAQWVQACLLPEQSIIEHSFVDIAGHFHPADTCSGDWWAVDPLPDGRVILVIGDVTGHGVGPAMITAIARGAYDVLRAHLGAQMTCEKLLLGMNGAVYRAAHHSLLMTCAVCILDPRSRTLSIANAGHTFPLLGRHRDGRGHIRELVNRGSPLGSTLDLDLSTMVVSLEPDDIIFWYTDGLIDCENEQGEQFGRKRLLRALRRQTEREPVVIRDTLRHMLDCFRGGRPQSDDVTFAAARIK